MGSNLILVLSCPDKPGIVHAVSGVILKVNGNILESAQFYDPSTKRFSMRVCFSISADQSLERVEREFADTGDRFSMKWTIHDSEIPSRVLVMVSKFDHCLVDLLYRQSIGDLPISIPAIVSNHRDAEKAAVAYRTPFHYLPMSPETRDTQEKKLRQIIEDAQVDFVVLARYMQILSKELCAELTGRVINIHHSFLPGFKGARPYHQAHQRGVKLIGATAHYATGDLDEGPIIEQDVSHVTHAQSPDQLVALGREIEQRVLGRAVKYQAEHRVILNDSKTIVFA